MCTGRYRKRLVSLVILLLLGFLMANHRGCSTTDPAESTWVEETASIQKWIKVDGVRIRVLDTGEGVPVLLIHGFLDSSFTWRKLIPLLQDRYRVIALDLPGFGYSDKPPEAASFADYARFAVGVLDQLGIQRAFIAGNSMGGSVTLQVAIDSPERVLGIAPMDPGTPRDEDDGSFSPINLLKMPVMGEIGVHTMGPLVFKRVWTSMLPRGTEIPEGDLQEMYGLLNTPGARRAALNQIREIRTNPVSWEATSGIDVPTLLIWGREDHVVPLKYGERLHATIPGSRMVIMENVGHLPQWEIPEELCGLLIDFFEETLALNR